jgi:hypothetical protein
MTRVSKQVLHSLLWIILACSLVTIPAQGQLAQQGSKLVGSGVVPIAAYIGKEDVQDMGDASSGLMRLRPVIFRYKQPFADGSKPIQYGLTAEEVEKVYPDLVTSDGQVQSVKYQVLDSMLLNEVQRQQKEIRDQREQIDMQGGQIRDLQEQTRELRTTLTSLSQQ